MKIKVMKNKQPKIFIDNNALNKMREYTKQVDNEVGWLGTVIRSSNNFLIKDTYLFKQEVHGATTEITVDGLSEFAMDLMSTEDGMEIWNDMKLWGHSHVNMSTSPSSQDDKQMELFESSGNDFFIRLITNKQGSMRFNLYDYTTGLIYEELGYEVHISGENASQINEVEKQIIELQKQVDEMKKLKEEDVLSITDEIKEKVKVKTYANYNGYTKGYGYTNGQTSYFDDFTSTYGYGKNKVDKEMDTVPSNVSKRAQELFDDLTENEVFELMMLITENEKVSEIITQELSVYESIDLEDMVYEYCDMYRTDYELWLDKNYGGII